MGVPLRVLFVEDREDDALLVALELKRAGYEITSARVDTREAMQEQLTHGEWDIIISDYSMPQFTALASLDVLKESGLDLPFIIVSGTVGEDVAVTALKAGAHDFIPKANLQRLAPAVARELREAASRRERRRAEQELRELEEQLRQAQKMEAVGRLAGGIAHDFNNVLTAIHGYAGLVLADTPSSDKRYQDVREILNAAERAAAFTRQLLAFSRKQVMQPTHLDLNVVVQDMNKLLQRVIGDSIDFTVDLDPTPQHVFADKSQIEQVIVNLVVNARDAVMDAGHGRIQLRTRAATLSAEEAGVQPEAEPGPYCILEVADNGTGIAPDHLAVIFEPFFTTKEVGKGTGLGLATVYGITKQNGGFVRVTSALGDGTTFSIYFPRSEARAAPVEHVTTNGVNPRSPENRCILVVEDEAAIRQLIARVLKRAGYRCVMAADPHEALEALDREPNIDLLLTDLMLPHMNGQQLAQRVLERRPNVTVCLMSGYAEQQVDADVAYLEKPFTPNELLQKLGELLMERS